MGDRDLLARLLELGPSPRWRMARADGMEVAETRGGAARYDFERAAGWALDPPETCTEPPPGTTAVCEVDVDGDGDLDLVAACGGDDPAAPLPWWVLLKEGDAYQPVRGSSPEPGFCVVAVNASDRKILLRTDRGAVWTATFVR